MKSLNISLFIWVFSSADFSKLFTEHSKTLVFTLRVSKMWLDLNLDLSQTLVVNGTFLSLLFVLPILPQI